MVLSFFRYDMINTPQFIGLDNYFRMFIEDKVLITAILNTLKFSVVTGPIGFALAFMLAWMINELGPKARTLLAFLFYSPSLIGNALMIWQIMFSGDSYGYINSMLISLNIISEPIQWFTDSTYSMTLIIIIQLWMSMGAGFLANISGLQNVSVSLYEAGAIDGIRNRWQELWYVTLPNMKPQLLFGAILAITGAFGFGAIVTALCGFPSVDYCAHTIMHHLNDYGGMRYEIGYSSAIAVLLFLMMIGANMLVKRLLSKIGT